VLCLRLSEQDIFFLVAQRYSVYVHRLPHWVTATDLCAWLEGWNLSFTTCHFLRDSAGESRGAGFVRVAREEDLQPIVSENVRGRT
jgi:hypothetical protein